MSDTSSRKMVEGGFADPVFDGQSVFAAVLRATSRPGRIVDIEGLCMPPAPLSQAQGAMLLALADAETPVHLEGETEDAAGWLAFHAGARTCAPEDAAFALVGTSTVGEWLETFPLGTLAYPDRSATLLVEVDSLEEGAFFVLKGAGIKDVEGISIAGLADGFAAFRRANRALYPCGLDLFLTCGTRLLALPRSTVVREG